MATSMELSCVGLNGARRLPSSLGVLIGPSLLLVGASYYNWSGTAGAPVGHKVNDGRSQRNTHGPLLLLLLLPMLILAAWSYPDVLTMD